MSDVYDVERKHYHNNTRSRYKNQHLQWTKTIFEEKKESKDILSIKGGENCFIFEKSLGW